jgi:hypothetical protein
MFECHRTQAGVLREFSIGVEKFRRAPAYRFREPPNHGDVLYAHFDWGMDAATWRKLSARALDELQLGELL